MGLFLCLLFAQPSLADRLWATPAQVEGPYYPAVEPKEKDWNLLETAQGNNELADGTPLQLEGKILDHNGAPIVGAIIEIWQSDNNGIYKHPKAPRTDRFDQRFQGFGAVETNSDGYYRFLTIMPASEQKRPPHIHVKIFRNNREALTTQLYLKDHPENNRDGIMSLMLYPGQQKLLIDPENAILENGVNGRKAWFDFIVAKNF